MANGTNWKRKKKARGPGGRRPGVTEKRKKTKIDEFDVGLYYIIQLRTMQLQVARLIMMLCGQPARRRVPAAARESGR